MNPRSKGAEGRRRRAMVDVVDVAQVHGVGVSRRWDSWE
jgi:hypothetical protein